MLGSHVANVEQRSMISRTSSGCSGGSLGGGGRLGGKRLGVECECWTRGI